MIEEGEITFRAVSVFDPDAQLLMAELNRSLTAIVGDDGSMYLRLNDFDMERSVFVIGYVNGEAACCAGLREMDADSAELRRVYARRNRIGLGHYLVEEMTRRAIAFGYKRFYLKCRESNPHAVSFYLRNGCTVCERYGQYANMPDAVCMVKELPAPARA